MINFLTISTLITALLLVILFLSFDGDIDLKWIAYSIVTTIGIIAAAGLTAAMTVIALS